MPFSTSHCLKAALYLLAATSAALNIIINNDDGFDSTNAREFYRLKQMAVTLDRGACALPERSR